MSFGETGADTNREVDILQQAVWRTDPDFVLLEWYVNDLENGDHLKRPQPYVLIPGDGRLGAATHGSLLRALLEQEFATLQERLGLTETYPEYMNRLFGDTASPHWQAAAHELRRFIAECRAHRTPVAIALFPHLSAGLSDRRLRVRRPPRPGPGDLPGGIGALRRSPRDVRAVPGLPEPLGESLRRAPERPCPPAGGRADPGGAGAALARLRGPARGRPARPRREGQSRRRTGFRSVPIPSIVIVTTSPGASACSSGTRMPVPVESTVPGGTGL